MAERLRKQEMVSSACHWVPRLALTPSPDPEGHKVRPVLSSGCQQGSVVLRKGSAKAPQAVLCKLRGSETHFSWSNAVKKARPPPS